MTDGSTSFYLSLGKSRGGSQFQWDKFYLGLAKYVSTKSKDPSTKVGSVIVRPDQTIAGIGLNGFPRGMKDHKEWYDDRDEKYSRIIHAEMNAMINTRENVLGCTLYNYPLLPCDRCMVQLIQAGIKTVVSIQLTDDIKARWETSLTKTRKYAEETGVEVWEMPHSIVP